jgi:nitrogenase molybdenum-iron protein alpha/beta subunit
VWLAGAPTAALGRVAEADVIVSLPYGRRAAAVLAERLGCELVRGELPFGLAAALRFVVTLGAATGRLERAVRFCEDELRAVLPRLQWAVPFAFLHRRLGYVGDPHLFVGLRDLAALVGCRVRFAAFTNLPRHARDSAPVADGLAGLALPEDLRQLMAAPAAEPPPTVLTYPHARELEQALERLGRDQEVDLLVTNSFGFLARGMGVVELGFPAYHSHALSERPFLGIGGVLPVLERMMEALRAFEVRAAHGAPAP